MYRSKKVKNVPVNVKWIGKKTKSLPTGKQYITISKFNEDLNWSKEAWSIVLEFEISAKQQGNPSKAKAHFLMDNAPQNRLSNGNQFQLYEGKDLVAEVTVENEKTGHVSVCDL